MLDGRLAGARNRLPILPFPTIGHHPLPAEVAVPVAVTVLVAVAVGAGEEVPFAMGDRVAVGVVVVVGEEAAAGGQGMGCPDFPFPQ